MFLPGPQWALGASKAQFWPRDLDTSGTFLIHRERALGPDQADVGMLEVLGQGVGIRQAVLGLRH